MVQVNAQTREVSLKVVYYGPALSGKTTNLQALFQRIDPSARGRLMTLDTKDDRTLFFDMLPVTLRGASGMTVKLKIYSVPGQVMHESTRRLVLAGTDAVVFVADSRRAEAQNTQTSWNEMMANLRANGVDPEDVPIVVQMNKRDLPDALGASEFAELSGASSSAFVPAVAVRSEGVVETFHLLLALAFRRLDRLMSIGETCRVREDEFLGDIFSRVDVAGTALPAAGVAR
ncbi:MAG TPA: ADP-ribosylation factor-like protein [Anaeromyxobacteraceae bacterium]|nr:ADP-ribosylation factor-like protein [Anaeromyxobacteraceae bacterium]